jgi:hypothetical protein
MKRFGDVGHRFAWALVLGAVGAHAMHTGDAGQWSARTTFGMPVETGGAAHSHEESRVPALMRLAAVTSASSIAGTRPTAAHL